jgi:hypothetical protein
MSACDSKVQPLIMGQSTFTMASDMNFFSSNSDNDTASLTSSISLGKDIQKVITSHVEASRIGKQIGMYFEISKNQFIP